MRNWVGPEWKVNLLPWGHVKTSSLAKANISCEFTSYKVGKTENVENKLIQLERVAWDLCKRNQRWSRWNVEECKLFRNFNSIHTINHNFPKRQVSQTPYLYNRRSVIEDENILFYVRMHRKRLKLNGTQQTIPSGAKHDISDQSLRPAYHYKILYGPPLLQLALRVHKNHSTPNRVHWW